MHTVLNRTEAAAGCRTVWLFLHADKHYFSQRDCRHYFLSLLYCWLSGRVCHVLELLRQNSAVWFKSTQNATWGTIQLSPFSSPRLVFTDAMEKATGMKDEKPVFIDGHPELTLRPSRPALSLPAWWLSRFLRSQMMWWQQRLRMLLVTLSKRVQTSPARVGRFVSNGVGFGSFWSSGRWMRGPLSCMSPRSPPGTLHSLWELSQVSVPTWVPHHVRIYWHIPGQSNYSFGFYCVSNILLHPYINILKVYFIF